MYTKFDIENNTHQCKQCGMKFYNYYEFKNHQKKFCINKGLNSIQGLIQYKVTNVFKDQLKHTGQRYLGLMKYSPTQIQQLPINRPNTQKRNARYLGLGINSKENILYQNRQKQNFEVNQKQIMFGNNQANINPNYSFGKSRRRPLTNQHNVINSQNNRNQQNDHIKQNSISPPSMLISPFAKRPCQTVLNKSHDSIAEMSKSQRKFYAEQKLIQLRNIEDLYDQSGGVSMDFRRKLQKMRQFYRKMLADEQAKQYPGFLVESKVQSVFSRHKQNNHNNNRQIKKYPTDALDKQIFQNNNLNNKINSNSKQDINSQSSIQPNNAISYPHPYPYYHQPQPQIIMIPPYPQPQQYIPQQNTQVLRQQTNYYRNILQRKNQQNNELMKLIMQAKSQNKPEQMTQQTKKQNKKIPQPLYLQTPMNQTPQIQQKILLALQRQQLDQLKLFSTLPEQLQQIRMQSIAKLTEQRIQLEKQVLQQKAKRLEQQQKNQFYEEQIRLAKNDWVNQQRKELIFHQMGEILHNIKSGISEQNQRDGQEEDEQEEDDVYNEHGNEQGQHQQGGWQ